MHREVRPICEQNTEKYDQDFFCEINRKDVDRVWSEWAIEDLFESTDQFDQFDQVQRRRIVVDFAHGGLIGTALFPLIHRKLEFGTKKRGNGRKVFFSFFSSKRYYFSYQSN